MEGGEEVSRFREPGENFPEPARAFWLRLRHEGEGEGGRVRVAWFASSKQLALLPCPWTAGAPSVSMADDWKRHLGQLEPKQLLLLLLSRRRGCPHKHARRSCGLAGVLPTLREDRCACG